MVSKETKIWLYRKMVEIREFEDASLPRFQRPGRGSHHPANGNEAIEAAVGAALRERDYLFGTHRSHGQLLAKGLDAKRIMAELWGKTTGYCQGRGGSMHVTDWEKRVLPSGIVGTSITLAVGAALSIRMRGLDEVALACFGDGAVNTGAFHEGLNMAAIWKLPAVFLCENNQLAVSTHFSDSTAVRRVSDRAAAYSMPGSTVDGTDPVTCYEEVLEAIERARRGDGPSLIEAVTWRWRGHAAWDHGAYLTEEELETMRAHDPIPAYRERLTRERVLKDSEAEDIVRLTKAAMQEAVRFAEESPSPPLTKEEAARFAYV